MKRLLPLLLSLVLALPAAAGEVPLVIQAGQVKRLPAATALQLNAPTTGNPSINLPHGTAPASPTNGDCWTTTAGLYCRISGATVGPYGSGTGSVSSVAATAPTGFSVSGSPITSSGTLAISFSAGYSLPTDATQANWNTAYGWGNHASAGYLTGAAIGSTVQAFDADLSALAALSGTNTIYYRSAASTWSAVTVGNNLSFSGGSLSVDKTLADATYTPTLTGIANVSGSSVGGALYSRVGSRVTVSGRITVTPTAGATRTDINISLPIASNFTGNADLAGSAAHISGSPNVLGAGLVFSDATNDTLRIAFVSSNTSDHTITFTAQYTIM